MATYPFSKDEVHDQSVCSDRVDPCFADAKALGEALKGQAPCCDQGGWRAAGAVCLYGAEARGVSAFRVHVVSDAWARTGGRGSEGSNGVVEPLQFFRERFVMVFGSIRV